ncbi:2-C-methyl-D-erythritol 2,4-cyclodiphosphate synthase [Alicyclobacillus acidocaldarius]|uniref:2-C-methyl-D-erythritol 2,4-cyclodiphosphate synthase n=1 Tax=Alicyclobacillus acidocaldarius subsp. acidocaldarius (strain ATCC 27009 / DSM 446 / BCRC 14685 / JCM 5260 / KCTC 1825 / NBRC 15652 / NCIMB 11725 / NRRL B-14509 / 104-IA) TaxID=521098 RepID=C8WTZ6_ALIAD|nr:2-C-methyl-D-erythritol 2,4-cyclodiphosphate synthase [Alicyclobacillus acidocaldarius]ACV59738.1 2C-methyl-D-erythritol 2,4-cyclodiphosphate synthase [Alicyclobacillus acidocaldarius subsp. acidocaldarius DSM 446]
MRIGLGYDVHRIAEGRPLVLGGVRIDAPFGLLGHSDADVIAHAIIDALLGSLGLGDIGQHFPPDDDRFEGADSLSLMREVVAMIEREGYRVGNVDVMVIAERPKLLPHVPAMRRRLAEVLQVHERDVSIKATTNEKMGFIGRGEGIAAQAVALVVRLDKRGQTP